MSLLLHLLVVLLFVVSFREFKMPPPQSSTPQKIALDLRQFMPPAPKPAAKPIPPKPPVMPKPLSPEKPVQKPVEKKTEKSESKTKKTIAKAPLIATKSDENNITKEVKKAPKKLAKKEAPQKPLKQPAKPIIRYQPPSKPARSSDALANALMGSGTSMTPRASVQTFADKMVKQVYGKEFNTYTPKQQQFIKDKLGEIYRITQNALWARGYPDTALRMQVQGTNTVSFYLHPNGNISDLRLRTPIGYRALDENTIEVIKTAYKDYPKPQEKTRLMFYVTYQLY